MNKAELRKLIKKVIIPELKYDYVLHKDVLFTKINNSILKGFSFDISSFNQTRIIILFQPLFLEESDIVYTFGRILRTKERYEWWKLEEKENLNYLINMLKQLEESTISKINTPLDLYNHFKLNEELGLRYEEALAFTACKANLDIADSLFKKQIDTIVRENSPYEWVLDLKSKYETFLKLNIEQRQKKLIEWENKTIENLKLEKFIAR